MVIARLIILAHISALACATCSLFSSSDGKCCTNPIPDAQESVFLLLLSSTRLAPSEFARKFAPARLRQRRGRAVKHPAE